MWIFIASTETEWLAYQCECSQKSIENEKNTQKCSNFEFFFVYVARWKSNWTLFIRFTVQPLDICFEMFDCSSIFSPIIVPTSARTHNLNAFFSLFSLVGQRVSKWEYSSECFISRFCRYSYFRNDKTPNEYSNLFFSVWLWMTSRRCSHLEVNISRFFFLNALHILFPTLFCFRSSLICVFSHFD